MACPLVAEMPRPEGLDAPVPRVRRGLSPERPLSELLPRRWTTEEGLPSNTLSDLLFTRRGELWIASFSGLSRFDGLSFTVFDKETVPELETNGFYAIFEGDDDTLWLGTQGGGIWSLRDGRFERHFGDLLQGTVGTLMLDHQQRLWASVNGQGVARFEEGKLVWLDLPMLRNVIVTELLEHPPGVLWLGTDKRGVIRLEGDRVQAFTVDDGLPSNSINLLATENEGLWIGTQNGLVYWENGVLTVDEELGSSGINDVRRDDYGNLWIATERGLVRRNALDGRLENLVIEGAQNLGAASAIAFDQEGSLWFSSSARGLYQLRESMISRFGESSGLIDSRANIVVEIEPGVLLAGFDGGLIYRIDPQGNTPLPLDPPLADGRIRDFLRDRRGNVWIASYAGLLRLAPDGEQRLYTTVDGLPANQIRVLLEDRRGRLWIGTGNGGLARLDGGRFEVLDMASGLLSNFIFSLEESPQGDLLVGTHEGLNVLHPDGSITTYRSHRDLPGSLVFNTHTAEDGAVWVCTNGGLARLHDHGSRVLTEREGLPDEAVFDLVFDRLGNAWMSSAMGIVQVPQGQLEAYMDGTRQRVEATVYDHREGLANRECTGATRLTLASDGRLWIPTLGGLSALDPSHIPTNPIPPPVLIHRFEVDGETIEPSLKDPTEITQAGRRFVFGFSALSFLVPSRTQVRYRLEGLDEEWIDAGADRSAVYTSLPPGEYAFHVIAANNDGVWNDVGASIAFRIRPKLHQTFLFRAASVLTLALAGLGLFRWRMKVVERRNQRLEGIISDLRSAQGERQQLIEELELRNDEMERFIYTVSHDLKSPLLTIRGFLGLVERDAVKGRLDRLAGNIERIDGAAVRMAQLLDELLELSRIGRMRNPSTTCDLKTVTAEALELVAGRLESHGVVVEIADDLPAVQGDRPRLVEVFQNLVDNAVKFMGDQSEPRITIGCRPANPRPVITVGDNGIGIEPAYHEKVFGLFDRLDAKTEGTGVGLAIVQRIVEIHGGTIWVESEGLAGEGSTFCFTLDNEVATQA